MSRPRAETMPAVTVPPSPNGLPIASTQSPTRSASESPNGTAGSGLSGFTCNKAMSPVSSRPSTFAFSEVLSCKRHGDLVGAVDHVVVGHNEARRIDDEAGTQALHPALGLPAADPGRPVPPGRLRLRKSLKNCSNGEPGGNSGTSGPAPGAAGTRLHRLGGGDVHHRRQQFRREIGETVGRRPGIRLARAATPAASGMASATARATVAARADRQRIRRMVGLSLEDWPHMVRRAAAGNCASAPPAPEAPEDSAENHCRG